MKQKTVTPRITVCIALRKTMRLVQLLCHTAVRRQIVQELCRKQETAFSTYFLACCGRTQKQLLMPSPKSSNISQRATYPEHRILQNTGSIRNIYLYLYKFALNFDVTKTSHSVEKFVNRAFCPQIQIHKHSHCHKHFYFLNKTLAFISCVPTYTCLQKRSVNLAFDRLLVNHMQFSSN